jgi:ElaB/YqjD/DUF883 family membrane-anchored ribosome-binding protein
MLTSPNGAAAKRDLHVGGVGMSAAGGALASISSVIDPLIDATENWVHQARDFASSADDYVRNNPWAALGVAAIVGVTLGYFLTHSRRAS